MVLTIFQNNIFLVQIEQLYRIYNQNLLPKECPHYKFQGYNCHLHLLVVLLLDSGKGTDKRVLRQRLSLSTNQFFHLHYMLHQLYLDQLFLDMQ